MGKKPAKKPTTRKQKPEEDVFKIAIGSSDFQITWGYIQLSNYGTGKLHGDLYKTSPGVPGAFNSRDLGNIDEVITRAGNITTSAKISNGYTSIYISPQDVGTGMKCGIVLNDKKQRILICE